MDDEWITWRLYVLFNSVSWFGRGSLDCADSNADLGFICSHMRQVSFVSPISRGNVPREAQRDGPVQFEEKFS